MQLMEITKGENMGEQTYENTVNAYHELKNAGFMDKGNNLLLGKDDTSRSASPNFVTKVRVWTNTDKQTHKYFHSLSIDAQVTEFMSTAELKAPFDPKLMEYWEPIRATCVIYGANKGDPQILFVGRVREVRQDGYELVVQLQNYGWKFEQNASANFVKQNVLNKDGYTIMRLILKALRIENWVISPSAKNRLKQVGFDEDGTVTMNGKEIKEIPDLIKRIGKMNPSDVVDSYTLDNKLNEEKLSNLTNLNYTLKYEAPTKEMSKIASESNYSKGNNVYSDVNYGSSSSGSSSGSSSSGPSNKPTGVAAKDKNSIKSYLKKTFKGHPWVSSDYAVESMYWFYRVWHGGIDPWATSVDKAEKTMKNYLKYNKNNKKVEKSVKNCIQTIKGGATKNKSWYPDIGVQPSSGQTGIVGDILSFLGF